MRPGPPNEEPLEWERMGTMKLPIYQIDAFASRVFTGNPAAVCPLPAWLPDETLQSIAMENNLSETAFVVKEGADYAIRWFTPQAEVDLCGHATLASAFVVLHYLEPARDSVLFSSQSGPLPVQREGEWLVLDFPSRPAAPVTAPAGLADALGARPKEVLRARDLMAVFENEEEVRSLRPNFWALRELGEVGTIVTARAAGCDFVSRFFAPEVGIPEDPVTGSAHCTLVPYWAGQLGKNRLHAFQVSARGGELVCELRGERVSIGGRAAAYLVGSIELSSAT
jgi:PhzF family phenazine biosynthesis protein